MKKIKVPTVYVVDRQFQLRGRLPYSSLQYERSWQVVGNEWELHVPGINELAAQMKKGWLISLDGDPSRCGIVDRVQFVDSDTPEIVIYGYPCTWLTRTRVLMRPNDEYLAYVNRFYDPVPFQTDYDDTKSEPWVSGETVMKTYVSRHMVNPDDEKRKIPNMVIAEDQNRGIEYMCWLGKPGIKLDETLQDIGEYATLGYEIQLDLDKGQFVFDVIAGVDRTVGQTQRKPVVFSVEAYDVNKVAYEEGLGSYANLAYAFGEEIAHPDFGSAGKSRAIVAYSQEEELPSGLDRYEIMVDCDDLSAVETATQFSMRQKTLQELSAHKLLQDISCSAQPMGVYEYRKDYDVGDLITARLPRFGIETDIRIVSVKEVYEGDKISIQPVFGELDSARTRILRALKK